MSDARLDPEMAEALRLNAGLQPPGDRDAMPMAEQRRIFSETRVFWNESPLPVGGLAEGRLRTSIAYRRYLPKHAEPGPLLVYLHGGGWVVGTLDTHDCVARNLCRHAGFEVCSLDYPLAPETFFEQIVDAIVRSVADLAMIEPGRRIALCGDSAGAHLAVFAAARLMPELGERLLGLVSVYGVLARRDDLPSFAAFGDGRYGLSSERMRLYWSHLSADSEADPLSLDSELPPTLVVAAELDLLRDSSYLFAAGLVCRGVLTVCETQTGMAHAFMGYGRTIGRVAQCARRVGTFLRQLD
ncbi:MAG: hypothetical protein CL535_00490 [Ahrensia sp.]|nr:hypothetical protein [Ahrensia sp.]|tara:strand:+ start:46403 stop:47299 length:897 start_codon:yes stop_codon:yes gene_type:complete